MNNDIKYKLANAMNECMVSSPVEKITVKEICDTCGDQTNLLQKFSGQI